MSTSKQFYLLGEDPLTAFKEIDISSVTDEDDLRHTIAAHFAIVQSAGVGFVSKDNAALTTLADVRAVEEPIAISIDGKAVREVPGPAGLPYIGNYFEVYPDHLGNHQRLFEQYGPLIKTTNLGSVVYHTNDPVLASIFFGESDFFTKNIIPGHPLHPIKNPESGVFLGDTDTEEWRTAHKVCCLIILQENKMSTNKKIVFASSIRTQGCPSLCTHYAKDDRRCVQGV